MKLGVATKALAGIAIIVVIAPLFSLLTKVPWSNFLSSLSDLTAIKLSLDLNYGCSNFIGFRCSACMGIG